jgi:hypothetical protein
MTKVVINTCYGGFGLSKQACELYAERKGLKVGKWNANWGFFENGDFYDREIPREDPILIEIVEELGAAASSQYSDLKVVNVPEDANWGVEEYDGKEWIAETHRTWY